MTEPESKTEETENILKKRLKCATEALIGVFGSKGAWPKMGREQGSMNRKLRSLGARGCLGKSFENVMPFS